MNSALIYLCVIFCLSAEAKNKPGSMDIIKKATANVQLKYNPLPTNTQLSKKYQLPKMQTPINRSIKTSIARNEPLKTQLKYHPLQQR